MSLQEDTVRTQFINDCFALWKNWNKRGAFSHRSDAREARVTQAVATMSNFMVGPRVKFKAISDWGGFSWSNWKLTLNNKYTAKHDIKYSVFVEYCSTIYHETRHGEQFYRIAQGLAQGRLIYPDVGQGQTIQALGGENLSVRDKIGIFGGGQRVQGSSLLPTATVLGKWLTIPVTVAQHAYNARAAFDTFTALTKPNWFQRNTILLEVEDWMRATYKKTYGEMDSFAQSEDDLPGTRRNVYKMYRSLPEEHDAHAIEDLVVRDLKTKIGHAGSENEKRTNTGIFGS